MKKISVLFAFFPLALAGAVLSSSACDGSPAGAPCNNDDDCASSEVCSAGECQAAQCADNVDCDVSVNGDGISKDDLNAGNTTCEDQLLVTVLSFDGSEICMTGRDDAVGCGEGLTATDVAVPGGGTASVCVSGDGVCNLGTCE